MSTENNKIAFPYYGGKQKHARDIIKVLPSTPEYIEPFCGSAAILLNRDPSPIETIGDINDDITNFFKVLRDNPEELIRRLELTPFARAELKRCWEYHPEPIERARRFFVRVNMDVAKAGKKQDTGFSCSVKYYKGKHSYPPKNFAKKVYNMNDIAMRLRMVQIENRPAIEVIRRFTTATSLCYCDPPYLPDTRTSANDYKYEMSVEEHEELAKVLVGAPGYFAVSGYDHPLYDEWYRGWNKIAFKKRRVSMSQNNLKRQEMIWCNYDPDTFRGQIKLNL